MNPGNKVPVEAGRSAGMWEQWIQLPGPLCAQQAVCGLEQAGASRACVSVLGRGNAEAAWQCPAEVGHRGKELQGRAGPCTWFGF